MPKTTIKVYFNNGCTTLIYNDLTSAEDMIGVVIKGRLSLNELRYKQCFQLRATRFSHPVKDFDPLYLSIKAPADEKSSDTNTVNPVIEEHYWLKNDMKIKEWLQMIDQKKDPNCNNEIDYWKLQLRIRYLSTDLNEIKFKDPVSFSYYYEQIKNDFTFIVASKIKNADLIPNLLDLGCLEMRRSFQNMNPSILDKKINYEYLEKDVGLKRFFPDIVLQQKSKNIKKMIIKGLKVHESLNEIECMLKYLEKLHTLWKFNEENFNCHLGSTWGVPINVKIGFDCEISCMMPNSKEPFQTAKFDKILQITTELDENERHGLLKLKIVDAKELLVFRFENLREAENLASLIDGYCSLKAKSSNLWSKVLKKEPETPTKTTSDINRKSFDQYNLQMKSNLNSPINRTANSVHILSESEDSKETTISIDTTSNGGSSNEFLTVETNEIKSDCIVFHEKLGSGQFGDVFRGTFKRNTNQYLEVAIKQLKIGENNIDNIEADDQAIITKKFIREAKIMEKFDHAHIIRFLGICYDGPLLIIMELAKFGQLKSYLQNNRDQIEIVTLILYSYQLSSAMAYLESKKFVHRDIAARNVLVANHESIKLADFGLSREIDDDIYLASKCKLPIKWMAPESINFRKFTSQSDVWMFAICVWEILSYGNKPFQGIKNPDVIKLIEDKKRLEQPANCPDELYLLMLQCWEYDSSLRPNFSVIKTILNHIHTNLKDSTKKVSNSLSNGSSFISNSSISSSVSSGNNIKRESNEITNFSSNNNLTNQNTVTMMMKMPLGKNVTTSCNSAETLLSNKFQTLDTSPFSPPPKPTRLNTTNLSLDNLSDKSSAKKAAASILKINTSMSNEYDSEKVNSEEKFKLNIQYSPSKLTPTHKRSPSESNSKSDFKYVTNNGSEKSEINSTHIDEKATSTAFLTSSISSSSSSGLNNSNKKDLLLRDQTLTFIQTISIFIRLLNTDNQTLDNELKEIMVALNNLIETIETIEVSSHSKSINKKVNELESLLSIMIDELKNNRIENVINTALEMARNANEMFLCITNKPVTKTSNV